jgi:hypothetical protein
VLTSRLVEKHPVPRSLAHFGAAIVLSAATVTSALAGSVVDFGCVGGPRSYNCTTQRAKAGDPYIRTVPDILGDAERAQAIQRDHEWFIRCRPVVERDGYGVARYRYSARGCEFGVGAD